MNRSPRLPAARIDACLAAIMRLGGGPGQADDAPDAPADAKAFRVDDAVWPIERFPAEGAG